MNMMPAFGDYGVLVGEPLRGVTVSEVFSGEQHAPNHSPSLCAERQDKSAKNLINPLT